MIISKLLKYIDPTLLISAHRFLMFRTSAVCGHGFRATDRSDIFIHDADRRKVKIGNAALIDGTIEVYRNGNLTIGSHFFLGRSRIYCSSQITIGDFVLISDNVSIMDSDLHPVQASRRRVIATNWSDGEFPDVYSDIISAPVTINNDVWVGFGASILKGVTIGQGAIVGAGSLVTSDVPAWSIVAGSPARVIRTLRDDER